MSSYYLSVFHVSLQLDLITDLLGTPSLEAMRTACEGAKAHILRGPHKQVNEGVGPELVTTWTGLLFQQNNDLGLFKQKRDLQVLFSFYCHSHK